MRKRLLIVALFAAIMALALCACSQSSASSSASADGSASASAASTSAAAVAMEALPADKYKTLGDAMSVQSDRTMWTYNSDNFIYAFKDNGKWVRVVTDMKDDVYKELSEMKMPDPTKVQELVGSFEVTQAETYVDSEPVQADLDKLVGKTGADLSAEGYMFDKPSVEDGKTVVNAIKLPYGFKVTFEGAIDDTKTDDVAIAVKDLPVVSIECQGLSFDAVRL